jgi:hypothetical protein
MSLETVGVDSLPARLVLEAGARQDWFRSPAGDEPVHSAPAVVFEAAGDFLLRARVTVDFRGTFDAGALVLHARDDCWAKLAFEYSPQAQPMVVSVVTRGLSDDANGLAVSEPSVWLRVARIGQAFAFHASSDGREWQLVRHFSLGAEPSAGFLAQSPLGDGCTATFDEIRFEHVRLGDIRDGS